MRCILSGELICVSASLVSILIFSRGKGVPYCSEFDIFSHDPFYGIGRRTYFLAAGTIVLDGTTRYKLPSPLGHLDLSIFSVGGCRCSALLAKEFIVAFINRIWQLSGNVQPIPNHLADHKFVLYLVIVVITTHASSPLGWLVVVRG